MGYGERLSEKIFSNPGQEFLSYALSKITPGKRKLKQEYVGGNVLDKFKEVAATGINRGRGSDFWGYNVKGGQTGFDESTGNIDQALKNTIGQSKLAKDKHGNVYSYDDYVFGSHKNEAPGFLNKLERGAQKFLGTNEGGTQYAGYRGDNPNAQPSIQSLGNLEEQGITPEQIAQLDDISKYVPDFEEKGYYDETGKKRGLIDRAMSKQTAWYPGKLAGKAVNWLGDRFGGEQPGEEITPSVIEKPASPISAAVDNIAPEQEIATQQDTRISDINERTAGSIREMAQSIDVQNPESVRAFQQATGLKPDGQFGKNTLAKLREIQGI